MTFFQYTVVFLFLPDTRTLFHEKYSKFIFLKSSCHVMSHLVEKVFFNNLTAKKQKHIFFQNEVDQIYVLLAYQCQSSQTSLLTFAHMRV